MDTLTIEKQKIQALVDEIERLRQVVDLQSRMIELKNTVISQLKIEHAETLAKLVLSAKGIL